jgi:hypothetical protein
MFLAALWSRCELAPQSGQECQRTEKPLWTITPLPEQAWLVEAGGTATCPFPTYCLESEDAQEGAPARIRDACRELVVPEYAGMVGRPPRRIMPTAPDPPAVG